MAVAAVAREPSPKERRVESCLGVGGVKESWLVARRRQRVARFESKAALPCEALSFITPMRSLSLAMSGSLVVRAQSNDGVERIKSRKEQSQWLTWWGSSSSWPPPPSIMIQ